MAKFHGPKLKLPIEQMREWFHPKRCRMASLDKLSVLLVYGDQKISKETQKLTEK